MNKRTRWVRAAGVILAALSWTACDDRPTPTAPAPSATTTTVPPTAPTTTRIAITGNTTLAALGATTQLTATATLSDGTTKDVTGETRWVTEDPRIISVSATGLVTVVNFGVSRVSAVYQNRSASSVVTITPPGTIAVLGRVREPGLSGLAGVRVVEVTSGRSTTSNQDGQFSIAELPRAPVRLRFSKDGYEQPPDLDVAPGALEDGVNVPLQRFIRLAAEQTVTPPPLAPFDVTYTVGDKVCQPCRRIRVTAPSAGTLNVKITWTVSPAGRLTLLAGGQTFSTASSVVTADLPITAAGEVVMYLGVVGQQELSAHTPFTIEATMR